MQTRDARAGIGRLASLVTFEAPGPLTPDGDGGYLETWAPLTPAVWPVWIAPAHRARAQTTERELASTVTTHASYLVRGRIHRGVTTAARMTDYAGRRYAITSVTITGRHQDEMELLADLQPPAAVATPAGASV